MHYVVKKGVYAIGGFELSTFYDNRVYLIDLGKYYVLVDSGSIFGFNDILRNMLELGFSPKRIKYIIISHAHIESSSGCYMFYHVSRTTQTIAHEPDASMIRKGDSKYTNACEYDVVYPSYPVTISIPQDVKSYTVSKEPLIMIIHTPGHTKGSISVVYEDNSHKLIFLSDALGPLCKEWYSNIDDYLNSLEELCGYEADLYCTSTECLQRREFLELSEKLKEKAIKGELWVECCRGKKST